MSGQAFTRQRERTGAPSGPLAQSLRSEERRVGSDWSSDVCSSDLTEAWLAAGFPIGDNNVGTGVYTPAREDRRPKRASGAIIDASEKHIDRKSTRLNSSHLGISYAVFCL